MSGNSERRIDLERQLKCNSTWVGVLNLMAMALIVTAVFVRLDNYWPVMPLPVLLLLALVIVIIRRRAITRKLRKLQTE